MIDPRPRFNTDPAPNPLGATVLLVTVVTPDIGRSIHFYRDVLGYELIRSGQLEDGVSTFPGADQAGRDYALLRQRMSSSVPGIVRLLEAPADARAIRPRDKAAILDDGLAALDLLTPDDAKAFGALTGHGVETLSMPQYYRLLAPKAGPGPEARRDTQELELKLFAAFGPAGELLLINRGLALSGQPWPAWSEPEARFFGGRCVLACRDRWPMFDFYKRVFGVTPGSDRYVQQDPMNVATGAPLGAYFRYGRLGDGMGVEWREFRGAQPSPEPPFPAGLDRTGLAMMTVGVRDLALVRANASAAGAPVLGEGALPRPGALRDKGFHLRGVLGELIEVVKHDG